MIDIQFEIGGKPVNPNNIGDAIERAAFDAVAEDLRATLASVRDPDTGEFPKVVVRGNSLDTMSIHFEGSEAVVALACEKLEIEFDKVTDTTAE